MPRVDRAEVPGAAGTAGPRPRDSRELLTVKVRYKPPGGDASKLLSGRCSTPRAAHRGASSDFRFAAAVAAFGMLLRDSPHKGSATLDDVARLARSASRHDPSGQRGEFIRLVQTARGLMGPNGERADRCITSPTRQRGRPAASSWSLELVSRGTGNVYRRASRFAYTPASRLRKFGSRFRTSSNPKGVHAMATATAKPKATIKPPKVKDQPLFIGGKWVDSVSRQDVRDHQPRHRRDHLPGRRGRQGRRRPGRQGRPQGVRGRARGRR